MGQVNGDNKEKIKALDNRIESRQAEVEKLKKEKDELDKNFIKQKEVATQAQLSAESLMSKNLSAAKSLKENSLSKKKSNVAYKNAKASRKASKTARKEASKANAMEKRVKKMNKRISKSEKDLSKLKSRREKL
ncbi:hypothetical protein KJS94_14295 [Flavihumibacter rivuli]|uniref:hypothetical protein n=1 Tax=Flavihumibacter rivuli TaxID=2838156 RepID=UPI001BDEA877|nr:hypothetical protein [Flavihumibacter rivuli]ULQ55816.1 hypothetical protein KJS94_14295 [Flavihumibacter rivuli]